MLDNAHLGATLCFASKFALFDALESYNTRFLRMDGVVFAHVCAIASNLRCACLANEYLTSGYFLAAKSLDAKSLTRTIVDVFA